MSITKKLNDGLRNTSRNRLTCILLTSAGLAGIVPIHEMRLNQVNAEYRRMYELKSCADANILYAMEHEFQRRYAIKQQGNDTVPGLELSFLSGIPKYGSRLNEKFAKEGNLLRNELTILYLNRPESALELPCQHNLVGDVAK